jgi:hypothetical protein
MSLWYVGSVRKAQDRPELTVVETEEQEIGSIAPRLSLRMMNKLAPQQLNRPYRSDTGDSDDTVEHSTPTCLDLLVEWGPCSDRGFANPKVYW